MKKSSVLIILSMLFSCSNDDAEQLYGTWRVDSKFYKAKYEILEVEDEVKAKIKYYNDDTTVIKEDVANPRYILNNLLQKENVFVDAVSGATTSNEHITEIKPKHKDTLEVITYLMNKPLKELWIRIN